MRCSQTLSNISSTDWEKNHWSDETSPAFWVWARFAGSIFILPNSSLLIQCIMSLLCNKLIPELRAFVYEYTNPIFFSTLSKGIQVRCFGKSFCLFHHRKKKMMDSQPKNFLTNYSSINVRKYELLDTFYNKQQSLFPEPFLFKTILQQSLNVDQHSKVPEKNLVQVFIGKVSCFSWTGFVRVFVL